MSRLMELFICLALALLTGLAVLFLGTSVDASRALVVPTNPHVAALERQEGGTQVPPNTGTPFVTSAAPTEIATQAQGVQPGASPAVGSDEPSARPTSTPRHSVGSPLLAGWASWYFNGDGIYLAAGPVLRRTLGDWRGRTVMVCAFGSGHALCSPSVASDFCACGPRRGLPTLADLSRDLYARICAPLSSGICRVTIEPLQ